MKKTTKSISWWPGILVAFMIGLTIYTIVSGNYEIGGNIFCGVLVLVFGTYFISSAIRYIIGMSKLNEKNENIYQEKVTKKKSLPIYSHKRTWGGIIGLYFVLIVLGGLKFGNDFPKFGLIHIIILLLILLILVMVFTFIFSQRKVLCLYRNNPKVLNYFDKIENFEKIFFLYLYINHRRSFHK